VRLSFRSKLFIAAAATGMAIAVMTAAVLSWSLRREINASIEDRLLLETRLVAEVLERSPAAPEPAGYSREAGRLASLVSARVTLIAADGHLLGDSAVPADRLSHVEEHGHRPEVIDASRLGIGRALRYSTTVDKEMLYTAARVRHPAIAFVRLSIPTADIQQQLTAALPATVLAVGLGLWFALAGAWALSLPLARRVRDIATVAERYARGDLSPPPIDYGDDELGQVAQTLDDAVQELGRKLRDLARNRARTDAMLAGMVEGVLVMDEQGRLQLANAAARTMLRIDGTAIGRHHTEVIRQPDIVRQVSRALAGDEPAGVEITLGIDPNRVFVARAAPARAPRAEGAVLVLHDISDLRRADRIRRDFVANVSHELRTPLTAIRGYVEALLDEQPDEHSRAFLDVIFRHTQRMERLVGDLLLLARLDARQETAERSPVDLHAVVNGVIAELEPLMQAREARVDPSISDAARTIVSDGARLHDILRNLLENAINYSPEHGTVTISARRRDGGIELQVADRGPGIPPADLERVFERFYRVDKSRTRNPGGTGIGLAIVKHLVQLLDGEVSAGNREGGGAVFTVRIP
jgi:two-component system, OmpR family, phosphate regulon sensor histidine kinase PhoR